MKIKWFLLALLVLTVLSACGRNMQNGVSSVKNQTQKGINDAGQILTKASDGNMPAGNSAHLESIAKSIPQVQNARCVVLGNTAIVGVDVPADMERAQVDTVKYSVAEALKKDPQGVNALVTADIDLNRRISEIQTKMQNGQTLGAFADELGDIIGRIIPQFPRDTQGQTNQPASSAAPTRPPGATTVPQGSPAPAPANR